MLESRCSVAGRWLSLFRNLSPLVLGVFLAAGSSVVLAHEPANAAAATESSAAYAQTAAIGQPVDIDGTLQVLHEDYYDGTGRYRYFLEANGERFELHFQARRQGC